MKIRKLFSAVVAVAVAVSSFATTSGAEISVVLNPYIGTTTEQGTWGVDLYDSAKGIDYGIDLAEVASVSFLFAADDIEQFEGHINGMIRTQFEGGDISYSGDDYIRYSLGYSFFYGVDDEYLGINTFGYVHDIYAETVTAGCYTLTADVDNPIANGDADEVDKAAVYLQEFGADKISIIGAYVYDDEGNVLMSFDQYGTPIEYYSALLEDTIDEIRENLAAHESEFSVDFKLKELPGGDPGQFCLSLMEMAMDHTGVSYEGDYILCQCTEYGLGNTSELYHDGTNYVFDIDYYIDFFTTKDQEALVSDKVEEILESLDLDGKTDYEKICAIYEYVCDTTVYDYEALETEDILAHSAYAALCRNTAVCQGYATAIYRLMLEAGIDSRVVIGLGINPTTGEGEAHGWNIVELDGKYYYADSTWDSNFDDIEDYQFFLKGLEDFEDHEDLTMYHLYGYEMAETGYDCTPGHVHTIIKHDAKAPTCTEIGWNAYETCSECDYTTYEEIDKTGHDYNQTDAGNYICGNCGDSVEHVHKLIHHDSKAPTCTENGWAEYEECETCDYTTYEEIQAHGHYYIVFDTIYVCRDCEDVLFVTGIEYFTYGDLDNDGNINTRDVLLLRKYMAGGWDAVIVPMAADVNCDGKINNIDVLLLRKYIAGGWDVILGPAA